MAAEVKSAASALEQARKQRAAALLALRCAARDVAIEGADEAIPAKVSAALVLQESRQKVWDKWCADGQTLAALGTALEAAEAAQSQAVAELAARSRALPLPDLSAPAIRDALPALRRLQKFAEDHRQLCTRVAAMEQAVGKLEAIARRLARILNEPFEAGGDLLVLIERAKHRVGVAERAEQLREAETRAAHGRAGGRGPGQGRP